MTLHEIISKYISTPGATPGTTHFLECLQSKMMDTQKGNKKQKLTNWGTCTSLRGHSRGNTFSVMPQRRKEDMRKGDKKLRKGSTCRLRCHTWGDTFPGTHTKKKRTVCRRVTKSRS